MKRGFQVDTTSVLKARHLCLLKEGGVGGAQQGELTLGTVDTRTIYNGVHPRGGHELTHWVSHT